MLADCDIQHYTINLMLYLRIIKDNYIKIYNMNSLHKCIIMKKQLEF